MPTAVPSDAETPPPSRPERRRVLALAVGVWWVQRLLQAARPRRSGAPTPDDELHPPAPAGR